MKRNKSSPEDAEERRVVYTWWAPIRGVVIGKGREEKEGWWEKCRKVQDGVNVRAKMRAM